MLCSAARAADWPQWRYDAARGAASPESLPDRLGLVWSRQLPPPQPAWPASQPWLRFDESYSPVCGDGLLFVPSMAADSVTAYDLASGREAWRFYADGPVRLAPVYHDGRLWFGSDDGHLYCLDARRGTLHWRVRGGPSSRLVLGNERLISTWPVRSGPVFHEGVVYFTAGIWPFMGIFVHAIDARSGRTLWTNSGQGADWSIQPHRSPAFSGFVPRGYLAADGPWLIAAGGRTQPGCYDRRTGELRYFDFGPKNAGTWAVGIRDRWFFTGSQMVAVADGKPVLDTAAMVHDRDALYGIDGPSLCAWRLKLEEKLIEAPPAKKTSDKAVSKKVEKQPSAKETKTPGPKPPKKLIRVMALKPLWKTELPAAAQPRLMLKAGDDFVLAGPGWISAVRATGQPRRAAVRWQASFEGHPWDALAAGGRLVLVTTEGRLYCFGQPPAAPIVHTPDPPNTPGPASQLASKILVAAGNPEGYALAIGLQPELVEALAAQSQLRLIAVADDPSQLERLRRRWTETGLYGTRVAAIAGRPQDLALPPYMAELAVVDRMPAEAPQRVELVRRVFAALRPYGGRAVFFSLEPASLAELAIKASLEGAEVKPFQAGALLWRPGALPGAADWTHQYADAANTVVSRDRLVRLPLGLLWFGGPSNDDVLPRHGHGPAPQVAAGRLVIEGPDMLRAIDIYTGRLLWQTSLPGLGHFYDNTKHQPGANQIGANYVTLPDSVYVAREHAILVLDAASGRPRREIRTPPGPDGRPSYAGYLAVSGDLLVATESPEQYTTAGARLAVFDRTTGRRLWQRPSKYGFRHNAICAAGGRVYLIDSRPASLWDLLKRRGDQGAAKDYRPELLSLDAKTGRVLWSTAQNVFGTFLNYSQEHDILLQAGSAARDRAADEALRGMAAYRGADGKLLWSDLGRIHSGPCLLHHDTIITQGPAYSLLNGQPKLRRCPLTGRELPWRFARNYGCNTAIGCENLLTFRSAAAGFCDLASDGGTGNFGGFKSSCTSNLIAAGGLLTAADYTRTCTCRYQNQTSLALVHDPQVEIWTFNAIPTSGDRVRRVGINFGAPGDRRHENGTLWLDWPSRGGPSPDLPLEVQPPGATAYRQHSSLVHPGAPGTIPWVAASGLRGAGQITITLSRQPVEPRKYTVVLHFAEPESLAAGQRVFDVRVQGRQVLPGLDLAAQHGTMKAAAHRVPGVAIGDTLRVELQPRAERPTVISGIEILAEGW